MSKYRAECMSGYTDEFSPWFDTEEKAYEWLENISCRIDGSPKCESCQAEWEVFDDSDIQPTPTKQEEKE